MSASRLPSAGPRACVGQGRPSSAVVRTKSGRAGPQNERQGLLLFALLLFAPILFAPLLFAPATFFAVMICGGTLR